MKKRAIVRVGGLLAAAGLLLAIGSAGALDNDAIPAGQAFAQAAFGLALRRTGEKNPGVKKKESCRREPGSPRPQNGGEDRRSQYSTTGRKSQ